MKNLDELAHEYALGTDNNSADAQLGFKAGHASRDQEMKEKDERIADLEERKEYLIWIDGAPHKFYGEEWFLALTEWGPVCLKALPEEWTYDFKTMDETYIKKDKVLKWMQLPTSQFIPLSRSIVSLESALRSAKETLVNVHKDLESATDTIWTHDVVSMTCRERIDHALIDISEIMGESKKDK